MNKKGNHKSISMKSLFQTTCSMNFLNMFQRIVSLLMEKEKFLRIGRYERTPYSC